MSNHKPCKTSDRSLMVITEPAFNNLSWNISSISSSDIVPNTCTQLLRWSDMDQKCVLLGSLYDPYFLAYLFLVTVHTNLYVN